MTAVRHNEKANRFEADVEGGVAMVTYERSGDEIIFLHTEVPPEAAGQGVAQALVREALQYARDQKMTVVPDCPYVDSYLKRHHEYDDIVRDDYKT